MNRLISRIEEANRSQEDEDSHEKSGKQFKTDKKGNYRYFSDEDDLSEEEDSYEEKKRSPYENSTGRKTLLLNRTFTGREDWNRETLQAQSYDRTFILNGPVVKVYQTADDDGGQYDHAQIQHVTDLPPIYWNKSDDPIMPSNLLLHENEGKLVFLNERDPT